MQKFIVRLTSISLLLVMSLALLSTAPTTFGQDLGDDISGQLEPIGDIFGQTPDEDVLPETVANIIQVILGFLGIIFIILILYAGFRWMTSAGNEEAIEKSKKTIVAAVIGVVIVLAAFAITTFVIDNVLQATGADGLS